MNAHVAERERLPFNRDMFRWARERRELTVEEAAKRANVRPESIEAWERGEAVPTVRQARILSNYYERSFLEFFRTEPPPERPSDLVPDFRLHRGEERPRETRDLKDLQVWAEEMRLNVIDLYDILGEVAPSLPEAIRARIDEAPAAAAARAREALGLTLDEQLNLNQANRDALPKLLRNKLEAVGILVLKVNELGKFGARGLCIATEPVPIVAFGSESPSAQVFTLAHEFGHICLGESAISGPPIDTRQASPGQRVEQWCNQFAAAFLVPEASLAGQRVKPPRPAARISDDDLKVLARAYGVSAHAMLLRLIDLRYVEANFYWNEKRAEFLAAEQSFKAGGRPAYYGSRFRSAHGDLYTGLVLEAWSTRRITNHNAAEFMGIKDLRHLEDIRDRFGAS